MSHEPINSFVLRKATSGHHNSLFGSCHNNNRKHKTITLAPQSSLMNHHNSLRTMCPAGLKRSMPCTDLNSMLSSQVVDSHHWDVEMENLSPKRRRISPMDIKRDLSSATNPATEALDRFLRMAVEDFTPSFDMTDDYKLHAFVAPLKTTTTTMHELTRGMARVSASS